MRIKLLVLSGLVMGFMKVETASANSNVPFSFVQPNSITQPGGGGGDDKEKKEKGGKKEKDESTKDAKTSDVSAKPQQHARYSAKTAKQTSKYTQKEIMTRAKVRLFFHNMFNTKYGKPVNFRKTSARNRWSKGRRW
jgi:hypothetical protein